MAKEIEALDPSAPSSFFEYGIAIALTLTDKNKKYGDSFDLAARILEVLWPNGVPVEAYTDMLGVTRVIDKLFRISTNKRGEDDETPWKDIAGYGVLGWRNHEPTLVPSDSDE